MEEKEYLQTLGEQILNPHARTHVLEEIQEHIDEQMQDYIYRNVSGRSRKRSCPADGRPGCSRHGIKPDPSSPVSGCFVRHCGGSYIIRNFHAIYPVWF